MVLAVTIVSNGSDIPCVCIRRRSLPDSRVTVVTAVGQWSAVKAAQKVQLGNTLKYGQPSGCSTSAERYNLGMAMYTWTKVNGQHGVKQLKSGSCDDQR